MSALDVKFLRSGQFFSLAIQNHASFSSTGGTRFAAFGASRGGML
jgi:hypothetical protein